MKKVAQAREWLQEQLGEGWDIIISRMDDGEWGADADRTPGSPFGVSCSAFGRTPQAAAEALLAAAKEAGITPKSEYSPGEWAERAYSDTLKSRLMDAVASIRKWHGMGMDDETERRAWEIYWSSSPEMRPLREAIYTHDFRRAVDRT